MNTIKINKPAGEDEVIVNIGPCRDRVSPQRALELIAARELGEAFAVFTDDGWDLRVDDDGEGGLRLMDGDYCLAVYDADDDEADE